MNLTNTLEDMLAQSAVIVLGWRHQPWSDDSAVVLCAAELHVYDKNKNYVPFDAQKPETFFEVQRKVIPGSA